MIDRLDYYIPESRLGYNSGMGYGMGYGMGMGMPIGYGYGGGYVMNRDMFTLRGPLAWDQYGDPAAQTKTKEKEGGIWKKVLGGAAIVGASILAWRTPAIKDVLIKGKDYVVDLVKKFIK
ncbi:MAG: hypothetical protein NC191_00550 [Muribaculaceae bacterium]|nr:hypothetical protein [Muribaculaceae bacterium]